MYSVTADNDSVTADNVKKIKNENLGEKVVLYLN